MVNIRTKDQKKANKNNLKEENKNKKYKYSIKLQRVKRKN